MDKTLKIILGLLIVLFGTYTYFQWPGNLMALWTVIKALFGLGVIFIGLIFILVGVTE